MMFLPELVPRTVEELVSSVDEEAALLALETELEAQFKSIREAGKGGPEPLGCVRGCTGLEESDPDEDVEDDEVAEGDEETDLEGAQLMM
mmetsp:Transcript_27214/g.70614  ORF Transcript_27214/g.70614 Transcript_27214/m.70614 type:complete len:90 (-) Transcript_27214:322-591(-)|eukprot:jgi/Tetstr1/443859/TSEL_031813.t1